MATLTTSQIPNYNYLTPAQQATVKSAIAAGQTAAVINNFVQQSVSANYTPTSTLDPTVAQQYGITGTQFQTINPSMPNYVSPQTLQVAQQQTQKIQQTNAAQAAFKLPDPTTSNGTVTSPNGTQYVAIPADPTTGAPAQWYQINSTNSGNNYTPVGQDLKPATGATGPVAPLSQQQFTQTQNATTTDLATAKQQAYISSLPYTSVTNVDPSTGQTSVVKYQSVDPTVPNLSLIHI